MMEKLKLSIGFYTILIATLSFSCVGGSTGGHRTEIDSAEDQLIILQPDQVHDPQEHTNSLTESDVFDTENSLKAKLAEGSDFNWNDFKNELAAKAEAVGESFDREENEVASSWEKLNDKYVYRTLYSYHDGDLWLQTYYKENNPSATIDASTNEKGKLLTKEDKKDPSFEGVWNQMEEKAQSLFK